MKIEELLNHITVPVTNEEADVLAQFNGSAKRKRDFNAVSYTHLTLPTIYSV